MFIVEILDISCSELVMHAYIRGYHIAFAKIIISLTTSEHQRMPWLCFTSLIESLRNDSPNVSTTGGGLCVIKVFHAIVTGNDFLVFPLSYPNVCPHFFVSILVCFPVLWNIAYIHMWIHIEQLWTCLTIAFLLLCFVLNVIRRMCIIVY